MTPVLSPSLFRSAVGQLNHGGVGMRCQISRKRVQETRIRLARMVGEAKATRARGQIDAIDYVSLQAKDPRVTPSFIEHILRGRAKTVDADAYEAVREAQVRMFEAKAATLLHEAQMARQIGAGPDRLIAIETEFKRLMEAST